MHLTGIVNDHKMHISHIMHYVSAYEICPETRDMLIKAIEEAIKLAKETHEAQFVDQDGEFCLRISPNEHITIMIPWKEYKISKDENLTK